MLLELKRILFNEDSTIGHLYVDGKFFCHTLEDPDRGLDQGLGEEENNRLKMYGQTAIPTGMYEVIVSYSNRFKQKMPLLLNVQSYQGIRIHWGNAPEHTLGCILVGELSVTGNRIVNSKRTYANLVSLLNKASKKEKTLILISRVQTNATDLILPFNDLA